MLCIDPYQNFKKGRRIIPRSPIKRHFKVFSRFVIIQLFVCLILNGSCHCIFNKIEKMNNASLYNKIEKENVRFFTLKKLQLQNHIWALCSYKLSIHICQVNTKVDKKLYVIVRKEINVLKLYIIYLNFYVNSDTSLFQHRDKSK